MPIYEYLCHACNRVYSFLSPTYTPSHEPTCPRCGATDLTRQVSRFSFVRGGGGRSSPAGDGDAGSDTAPADDDPRMERAMMRLMADAENLDENDPRQLGAFMRRMSDLSGEPIEPEMEEAIRRLEAGEDPDKIEEDLGDVMGGTGDDGGYGGPSYDDGLYPM